jgi:hypothetical protein
LAARAVAGRVRPPPDFFRKRGRRSRARGHFGWQARRQRHVPIIASCPAPSRLRSVSTPLPHVFLASHTNATPRRLTLVLDGGESGRRPSHLPRLSIVRWVLAGHSLTNHCPAPSGSCSSAGRPRWLGPGSERRVDALVRTGHFAAHDANRNGNLVAGDLVIDKAPAYLAV